MEIDKKVKEMENKINKLEEQLKRSSENNNDMKEQIDFRNRYITQLEEMSKS